MTTDALDLSAYEDLKISFSFLTIGFDNILEDFWLQVSTDGGPNFTTIGEWDKGDEFENGIRYFEEVSLTGPFTSNMKFRFRCDASSDSDWLFIDNVEISGCFNPSALVANPDLENKAAKEGAIPFVSTDLESELETAPTNLQLFPNPVADELLVRFTMQEMTDVTVLLTDLQGRTIGREQLLNAQGTIEQRIAVEQYPAGIYLLHLITPEGKQIQKFVVARN